MNWREILKDYIQTPNQPYKHHPHKTLDAFVEFLEENYEVPEKKGEDEEE